MISRSYSSDCVFTDPTLSFEGLATFERNVAALRPLLLALVEDPVVELYSCELREPQAEVVASWRMIGDIRLPWKPVIDLCGQTRFEYDGDKGNRVVAYTETWEISGAEALRQIVTPNQHRPR